MSHAIDRALDSSKIVQRRNHERREIRSVEEFGIETFAISVSFSSCGLVAREVSSNGKGKEDPADINSRMHSACREIVRCMHAC